MPRPAAIILGLALVAFSIGFNTVQYPMVWEMVGPVQATESAQPETTPPQEKSENQPAARPAEPIEIMPAPEVGNQVVIGDELPVDAKPTSADRESRKPLVPVTLIRMSNASGNAVVGSEGIRRLPPVDANVAAPHVGQFVDGTIPIYPTTGIE